MLKLFPLLPALVLLLGAMLLLSVRWARPGFKYFWLIAATTGVLAWLAGLLARLLVPLAEQAVWHSTEMLEFDLKFAWDPVSWPLAFSVVALGLGAVLTGVHRSAEGDWLSWAGGLTVAGLGVLSTQSGTPATLLIVLAGLDLVSAGLALYFSEPGSPRALWGLAGRFASLGLIVLAGATLQFSTRPEATAGILLAAVFLRLALISFGERRDRPGRQLVTLINLVPAAGGVVLWVRILPELSASTATAPVVIAFMGLVAALAWINSPDEPQGSGHWLVGGGVLVAVSALSGLEAAAVSWGVALILSVGVLTLYQHHLRTGWAQVIPLVGFWTYSALPLAPTWDGAGLFAGPITPEKFLLLIVHAGLLAGYLIHATRGTEGIERLERWVRAIAPAGLLVLLVSHGIVAWWPWRGYAWLVTNPWWPGLVAVLIGGVAWWWLHRNPVNPGREVILALIDLRGGVVRILEVLTRAVGYAVSFLTAVLEGEGGVLWALLLLVLLVTVLLQAGLGGSG